MEKGSLIGKGRTADVYAWGSDRVLKLYQSWMPAIPIEREFAITRMARNAGLPVPAADELVEIEGRLGIIFERVEGISMLKMLETQPWRFMAASRQLAELHAHMHTCMIPPGSYTQRQQIERGIEMSEDLSDEAKETIREVLASLPEGQTVCHGDFHPDNILLTPHGPVIIDWMTGTRGNPLGDVSRPSLLFQTGGLPPRVPLHIRVIINASRTMMHAIYLDRYLHLHPATRQQVNAWQLPLLAARLFEVENYPQEKTIILRRIEASLPESR
jgi:uncharacterized protein (TIGR02172 family)